MRIILVFFLCAFARPSFSIVDLHTHFASHIPYWFMLFGGTPRDAPPAKLPTPKHAFLQQMHRQWLLDSGIKLFVDAALVNIFTFRAESARAQVLEQFAYTEQFVKDHSDAFALARSPEEALAALEKGKVVFVRALEGADHLVSSKEDVQFWKAQGVAMIGPIHLADNMYGDASIMPTRKLLNPTGLWRSWFTPGDRQGLTPLGKEAIELLIQAGIIVDVAHMSGLSTTQTLQIHEKFGKPLVMSHGYLYELTPDDRGLTREQITRINALGGLIGITSGADVLTPKGVDPQTLNYCPNSVDDYVFHYKVLQMTIGDSTPVGWASDANGFVNHFRPKQGEDGCHPGDAETTGLRGLFDLPRMLRYLDQQQVDTSAIRNSHVRFIEIWQKLRQSN